MNEPSAVFLAGPTAVGKSAVALALARQTGGEIISVDSMQVYRGMDIGTGKPSPEERMAVPHHLLDVAEIHEPFDAARFVALARAAVCSITRAGRTPIFCGGTGLYFQAYLGGLGDSPPSDAALRRALEAAPLEALLAELAENDPAHFARIDQRNRRRVIRAVEVIRLTGRPYSRQRATWQRNAETSDHAPAGAGVYFLVRARTDLRRRIEERVEDMFARGWVAETAALLQAGLRENRTAMQAIGYRQVVEHLDGTRDLAATVALVKQKTWQYARRQFTWFRHQLPVQTVELPPAESPEATAARLLERMDGTSLPPTGR